MKPRTAAGYSRDQVAQIRATCLYIATKLGDLLDDVVVVGGLVPSLLLGDTPGGHGHVGTADLDIGLALAVLDDKRYAALTERLRLAGFSADTNDQGRPASQRWFIEGPPKITVDFLIPPTRAEDVPGKLKHIEHDFAAIIAPGLHLAFLDQESLLLEGVTIRGEAAKRSIRVAGPGAFVAMKALALRLRGENKDAYDLFYLLRHYPGGVAAVAPRMMGLLAHAETTQALSFLGEDFETVDHIGPRRAAEFLFDRRHEETEVDAWGVVQDLLAAVRNNPG